MIRVLVTDDEPLVRFGLCALLGATEDITVVGEAADGVAALAQARALTPDLVLMDIQMPGMDGITATRQLRALPNPPIVLVLTTFDTEEGVTEALRAGAVGYLLKDAPPEQLVAAIRLVAAGSTVLAPASTAHLVNICRDRADQPSRIPPDQRRRLDKLTAQQHELLRLVGTGMSNSQIAHRMYLAEGTVKAYVSRLITTLKVENRTQAAILAHHAGFLDGE
ncbi:response regulator transcription factor [Crossiella cryophila]|uniref:DNA-binding NarL/FixJ family response regulator n=1 Tax=Crossiella cryophila TaxID=43355 RepID=A0A7W7FWC0_9PSEU|nr:response regulator transcription factor [Crossiella cryophila]MBB4680107.1 DNA-binding NarL/FixJ family response regulator [Crossiella cryophila]